MHSRELSPGVLFLMERAGGCFLMIMILSIVIILTLGHFRLSLSYESHES